MYRSRVCALCGGAVGAEGGREAAGQSLCEGCFGGRVASGLAARGLRVQVFTKASHPSCGHGGGLTREVRGAVPYDLGLTAFFDREGLLSKLGKLFKEELQTGDPEFDDRVYVRTDDAERLGRALSDQALRAAVLHAMDETGGHVVVEGNSVTIEAVTIEVELVPASLRSVALILACLEGFAQREGLPRRPDLARYPDLRATIESREEARFSGDTRFWPRGIYFQLSTLDDLDPVARIHALGQEGSQPLEILRLARCHLESDDLSPLAEMRRLRVLELRDLPSARSLAPLARLESLAELTVADCPVSDLSPLASLGELGELSLEGTLVSDLRPLSALPRLAKLDLRRTRVADLSPLATLPSLAILWIQGLDVGDDQVHALRMAHPSLELDPY